MKIIYSYILKELIQPFLFGVFAFTSIFVGSDVLVRLAKMMSKYGLPLLMAIKLFFLSLPQIILWTFPMAMLLAALLSFGRLSGDSEITALRAGGVSLVEIVVPVLIVGLLVTGLMIFFNNKLVPLSQNMYEEIEWKVKHGTVKPKTQRNLRIAPVDRNTGKLDFVLTADKYDGNTQSLEGVSYQDYNDGNLVGIIQADKAEWSGKKWIFIDGVIYTINKNGQVPQTKFGQMDMTDRLTRSPKEISRNQKSAEEMSIGELKEHIRLMEEEGRGVNELKVIYHQRYAFPFACFIFALVGAPLGLKPNRSGSSIGLGLSLIVIFIYYTIMTIGSHLGEAGTVFPWIGAWIQNIIFSIVGFYLLLKSSK